MEPDGNAACLVIRDDGPGVSESDMARLTDRFYRGTDAVAPGSGLGLSIVARIVSYFDGYLNLDRGIDGAGLAVMVSLRLSLADGPDRTDGIALSPKEGLGPSSCAQ